MITEPRQLPNTLRLPANAQTAIDLSSQADAIEAVAYASQAKCGLRCLGEGSNVVLMPEVQGLICYIKDTSIRVLSLDENFVTIAVGAGKNWHELVEETLAQGWFGLENLALIPGSVGAAPIQNIGAYGVEVAQFIESVNVIDPDQNVRDIPARACGFAYRDSVFKARLAAADTPLIILSVTLRLQRRPKVNLSYAELAEALEFDAGKGAMAGKPSGQARNAPTPTQVAAAVMAIRRNKLPDPYEHPNAGSFFKNPVIDDKTARRLETLAIKPYPFAEGYKVSAAQLIDSAGWKGTRSGDVGCWPNQPLVLVNYGQASAQDLLGFAQEIQRSVAERFEIQLELEPSVVS